MATTAWRNVTSIARNAWHNARIARAAAVSRQQRRHRWQAAAAAA
jgi:hypothetical protein